MVLYYLICNGVYGLQEVDNILTSYDILTGRYSLKKEEKSNVVFFCITICLCLWTFILLIILLLNVWIFLHNAYLEDCLYTLWMMLSISLITSIYELHIMVYPFTPYNYDKITIFSIFLIILLVFLIIMIKGNNAYYFILLFQRCGFLSFGVTMMIWTIRFACDDNYLFSVEAKMSIGSIRKFFNRVYDFILDYNTIAKIIMVFLVVGCIFYYLSLYKYELYDFKIGDKMIPVYVLKNEPYVEIVENLLYGLKCMFWHYDKETEFKKKKSYMLFDSLINHLNSGEIKLQIQRNDKTEDINQEQLKLIRLMIKDVTYSPTEIIFKIENDEYLTVINGI